MIRSIEIKGLRGIREGKLDDLAPLTIIVGPNGAGKSTILEAMLIGASLKPGDVIAQTLSRRSEVPRASRWLVRREKVQPTCEIVLTNLRGAKRSTNLAFHENQQQDTIHYIIPVSNTGEVEGDISYERYRGAEHRENRAERVVTRHPDTTRKQQVSRAFEQMLGIGEIRLIDAYLRGPHSQSLHQLYSSAVQRGAAAEIKAITTAVVPQLTDITILTEGDVPILHLVFPGYSVPAALAGDGVQMLMRLCMELASPAGGVVLLEEPEVHQHPGSIWQSAKAIKAAVDRDIQVILTTHSLEMIDALLEDTSDEILDRIAVYRVILEEGLLKSHRLAGSQARFAREQIEDDLR